MKIIFLDMDGVLNSHEHFMREGSTMSEWPKGHVDVNAVKRLNQIIARTEAKVVISSTWRKFLDFEQMQAVLNEHGFEGEVVGETPDFNRPEYQQELANLEHPPRFPHRFERGHEISYWLKKCPIDVYSYVVLDDSVDMATVRHRHVHTNFNVGLSEHDVEAAVSHLETGIRS
jgi:hypothetical protein